MGESGRVNHPTLTVSVDPDTSKVTARMVWGPANTAREVAGMLAMLIAGGMDKHLVNAPMTGGCDAGVAEEASDLFLAFLVKHRSDGDDLVVGPMEVFSNG